MQSSSTARSDQIEAWLFDGRINHGPAGRLHPHCDGVPQVKAGLYKYRLNGAVANATWAVQSTRYQALMEGYPYQVVFTAANQMYQIQNLPPGSASYANVGTAVPLSGSPITLNQDTTLQFKPNGAVTASVGGLSFTITYQGKTGTVTVTNYGNVSVVYN